jgi:hypothetical protein
VELGVRARDGGFARVARSARVAFPRRAPSPRADVVWMTVRPHDGAIEVAHPLPPAPRHEERPAGGARPSPREWRVEAFEVPGFAHEETETRALTWSGEQVEAWEEGPFESFAWCSPVEVRREHGAHVWQEAGRVRGVYARWEVVVRGIGAHGRREVLARWEITRSWGETGGAADTPDAAAPLGASEHRWRAGSELRLQGSSERLFQGASERRFGGASEWSFGGASWFRARGASERLLGGASERLLRDARPPGASERLLRDARPLGSSERLGRR